MHRTLLALVAVFAMSPVAAQPAPTQGGLKIPDHASAVGIAKSRGITAVESIELDRGVWEVKGRNSSGVFLEIRIVAESGDVVGRDYGHSSPMRTKRDSK